MKRIAVFCIPAHGHTNPILPVIRELVQRGDDVRFYSFQEFQDKIERTGATFISCDPYLPGLNAKEQEKLRNSFSKASHACSEDFHSCPGVKGAADFIENAPHTSDGADVIKKLGKINVGLQVAYSLLTILLGSILFRFIPAKYVWIYIIIAVVLSTPVNKALQKLAYQRLVI